MAGTLGMGPARRQWSGSDCLCLCPVCLEGRFLASEQALELSRGLPEQIKSTPHSPQQSCITIYLGSRSLNKTCGFFISSVDDSVNIPKHWTLRSFRCG